MPGGHPGDAPRDMPPLRPGEDPFQVPPPAPLDRDGNPMAPLDHDLPPAKKARAPVIVIDAPSYSPESPDKVIEAYSAVYDAIESVSDGTLLLVYDSECGTNADSELISAISCAIGADIVSDSRVLSMSGTVVSVSASGSLNATFLTLLGSNLSDNPVYATLVAAMLQRAMSGSEEGAYQMASSPQPVQSNSIKPPDPSGSDPPSYIPGTAEDRIIPSTYSEFLLSHVYDGGHAPFF